MSVEIHQFLDNSGGSNFTESAQRPPVGPGEENELHSTGGHSNKSSGSHKSLTSNRSNGSGNGGATPRRSQKPAKLPPTTANVASALAAVPSDKEGGEYEAPLGFEPEGSVDEKPEFTENSTPAYSKWAESLDNLLEDADGCSLFQKYLGQENSVNLFEFYFAWKYLQELDSEEMKGIGSLVKTMYKVYIKGDKGDKKLGLVSSESRETITRLVTSKQYSKTIYDSAKDQVVDVLKREFYLPFLKSSIYLQYVQSVLEDSPKDSANSSGSASARPLSTTVLPTVHEDSELELHHVTSVSNIHCSDASVLSLSSKNMVMTERLRSDYKVKPEDQAGYYLHTRDDGGMPPHPYHTYSSYAPAISAIDSERQSLSSEALTDDTHSITDSSVDGFPIFTNTRSIRKYHKRITRSAQRNPEAQGSSCHNILAPKTRLNKVSNLAETDPVEFAKVLCEKLQRVVDEQNHREMVRSKLSAMSEDEGTTDDNHSVLSSTTGGAGTTNTALNQLLSAMQAGSEDPQAQDILDMHCRRIWEKSGQHTPSKSPSRAKSPDHSSAHNPQAKRTYPQFNRQPVPQANTNFSLPYKSAITPSTKPLHTTASLAAYARVDSGYPLSSVTGPVSSNYTKSNSRQGMATFPSRDEQQCILKPPSGNQKVEEWISRNSGVMCAEPERQKTGGRKSQKSVDSAASPRTGSRNTRSHGKGMSSSGEGKRTSQDDKHSTKSKSTSSGKKDSKSLSRSVGDNSGMQTLTQRKGVPVPPAASMMPHLRVAYFLPDEPIPYSMSVAGAEITLSKFKEIVAKKGNYRYFFKKATDDEFGRDVPYVLEEITNDLQVLPKWDTKVVAYVKKAD